jgi:hypothetical protein
MDEIDLRQLIANRSNIDAGTKIKKRCCGRLLRAFLFEESILIMLSYDETGHNKTVVGIT